MRRSNKDRFLKNQTHTCKTNLMYRKLLLFFIASIFAADLFAQSGGISGSVKDTSTHASVKNAVIALLTPKDSVLKAFTRVNADGTFSLKNIPPGKYILSVTHPVFAEFIDDIEISAPDQQLSQIALTPKSKLLEAVILKSGNPIHLRGDTTVYTADSFKVSANANVEELLKKMPGIQVDKNGQIKAMGETVQTVLVDGEEFFGDDPGMAVKNIRADAVKEVQVFDKKSEQSEFTGIDDGKTKKTINLKLKEDKKKGYFGKIDMAGGPKPVSSLDPRYNSNILLSSFKGKRKISGFLLNGNTGQDGLNWQDEQKYGGGNDNVTMSMDDDGNTMYSWRGGGSDGEPYVNTQNGFLKNVNAGLQYSNKYNDKTTINFTPKYNSQVYNNEVQTNSQTLLRGDSVLNSYSDAASSVNRYNIKVRGTYDVKLDSMNTIKLSANTNYYHTKSEEISTGNTTGESGNLKNNYQKIFSTDNDKTALSGNMIFKHKFKKSRRTISLNADWKSINSNGTNFQQSANNDFANNITQAVDQMTDFTRLTSALASTVTYTEPLGKKYSLELGYRIGVNHGTNDQTTYTKAPGSVKYETPIDSLTNNFRQTIVENAPSAKINYNFKKLKVNVGAGVSFSDFQLRDLSSGAVYHRNYANFFPALNLNYSYKSNHNLRIGYSGTTTQPTINQLQPLRKNDDYFNQYIGNPDLKTSFRNSLNISHNGYNFIKDLWAYQSLNISLTQNSITDSRTIDYNSGKTITKPVNTNGNLNLSFWGGGGFKLKKADIRLGVNPNVSYSKYANIINDVKTFSKNLTTGIGANASKTKDKKYDISLGADYGHTSGKSSESRTAINYNTTVLWSNVTIYYKKVWSLVSEYNLNSQQKTDQSPAFHHSLLNEKLQRTFKKDEFTAYFSVRDVFNQNTGIERNFRDGTFTETRNERLKRFCMIGFAWNFKNKAPVAAK